MWLDMLEKKTLDLKYKHRFELYCDLEQVVENSVIFNEKRGETAPSVFTRSAREMLETAMKAIESVRGDSVLLWFLR